MSEHLPRGWFSDFMPPSLVAAARKLLPDGRVCEVWPATYGKGRITVGDGRTSNDDEW